MSLPELAETWLRAAVPNSEVQCDDALAGAIDLCVWATVTSQLDLSGQATVECRPCSLDDPVPAFQEVFPLITNQLSSWQEGLALQPLVLPG